jgi:hypothetical protein
MRRQNLNLLRKQAELRNRKAGNQKPAAGRKPVVVSIQQFETPKLLPKDNPARYAELLMAIGRRKQFIGKESMYYIHGYQSVLEAWGLLQGNRINLTKLGEIIIEYHKSGKLPDY